MLKKLLISIPFLSSFFSTPIVEVKIATDVLGKLQSSIEDTFKEYEKLSNEDLLELGSYYRKTIDHPNGSIIYIQSAFMLNGTYALYVTAEYQVDNLSFALAFTSLEIDPENNRLSWPIRYENETNEQRKLRIESFNLY